MKRLFIIITLLLATPVFAQHTYYISKVIGSDSNSSTQAQNPATPWAHLPGMPSCVNNCGSYTPVAGDHFILRGGDTWVNSDLGVGWVWAGNASACVLPYGSGATSSCIYIGVDQTFFNAAACGSSWCRPIFTCGGTACSSSAFGTGGYFGLGIIEDYLVFDNIEMTGLFNPGAFFSLSGSNNVEVKNMYFHGWSHGTGGNQSFAFECATNSGGTCANTLFHDSVIDGSDTTKDMFFASYGGNYERIYNNYYRYTSGAIVNVGINYFYNNTIEFPVFSYDGNHANAVFAGSQNTGEHLIMFNNVIRHSTACSGCVNYWFYGANTADPNLVAYGFNNVMYDLTSSNVLDITGSAGTGSNWGTYNIFNNTFQCGSDSNITQCTDGATGGHPYTGNFLDNHGIAGAWCGSFSCPNEVNDLVQSVAQANAAGYNSSQTYAFSPATASATTVGHGTNHQSICTTLTAIDAVTGAACKNDTTYGVGLDNVNHKVIFPARVTNARPLSAAWDQGAFQFSAPPLPSPVFTPIPGGYHPNGSTTDNTSLPCFPWAAAGCNPTVTIMDNQPGATLCYTTNGTVPTATVAGTCDSLAGEVSVAAGTYPTTAGFTQYQVPSSSIAAVTVTSTTTIKVIATLAGFANSALATGIYTIDASCVQPTITYATGQPVVAVTTGLDGTGGIGTTDGLAWAQLSWTTSVPTDARGEFGGGNAQTPYVVVPSLGQPAQDSTGTTSHTITFTGLLPGVPLVGGGSPTNQNWFYGVTSHTIGTGGLVCGSAAQVSFNPNYNGGLGGQLGGTQPPTTISGAMTAYKLHVRGSHHVTAGYSAYIAIDEYNLSGANPASGQFVLTLTGEPTTGTQFNWMGANTKVTGGSCNNTAIATTTINDTLTKTNVCNDTNTQSGVWGTREVQFVTCNGQASCGSVSTPPGTYTLNIAANCVASSLTCTAAASNTPWQIIVDAAATPFGISLTKTAPTTFPAIPNQAAYLNAINLFGKNFWICAQDNNGNDTIRPNDNSSLLPVSASSTLGSWFYDGVNAHFGTDYLRLNWAGDGVNNTQQNWSQCRENVTELYRDKNALASVQFQFNMFTEGTFTDYQNGGGLHGQALDKMLITQMITEPQSPFDAGNGSYLNFDFRDVAYSVRNYIHGVALGLDAGVPISAMSGTGATGPFTLTITSPLFATTPPTFWGVTGRPQPVVLSLFPTGPLATAYNKSFTANPYNGSSITVPSLSANLPACSSGGTSCGAAVAQIAPSATWNLNTVGATTTPMRAWVAYGVDHIISSMESACITQDPQYVVEQFFLALSARTLIEYYNLIDNTDPRIPPIIKACADYLYQQFQPGNVGAWRYTTEANFTQSNTTGGAPCTPGTNSCTPNNGSCVAVEDQLIPPMFAWMYNYSGQAIYQQEGDLMFGLGATFTTGNGGNTGQNQIPGGCYQTSSMNGALGHGSGSIGKIWSQFYYWGTQNYVAVRDPIFNIFPGSIGVYDQTQNTTSTPQIVTISNPLNPGVAASQTIGTATITGTNAANFSLGSTAGACAGAMAPGAAPCTGIQVTFSPAATLTAITAYNAVLNIPVGATNVYHVPLFGTGVIGTLPPVTFNPVPGTYGGAQNVQLSSLGATNICYQTAINKPQATGNGVLNVPGVVSGGGGTCIDGQSTTLPNNNTVAVNSTTNFVSSSATAPGWADSVPTNPQSIFTITNTPTATLTPASLAFGNQNINTTTAALTATITNTGSVNVVVTQAQVFSTNFTLVNGTGASACFAQFGSNTSFTLLPGGSCTWGITFTPSQTIAYVSGCPTSNCFSVTSNATGSPQTIGLSGQGTQATITWSSPQGGTAYNFGNVITNISVNSAALTLQNTGTGPLNVAITLTGANAAQFTIASTTCPGILPAGNTCTYTITFTPTAVASYSAALTETDNLASNTPQNLTLSGAGVAPPVQQVAPAPWVLIARRKGR